MPETIERSSEKYAPHGDVVATLFGRDDYRVYRTGYTEEEAIEHYVPAYYVESPRSKYFLYYTETGEYLTVSSAKTAMNAKIRGYTFFTPEFEPLK